MIEQMYAETNANLNEEGNYAETFFNENWSRSGLRDNVKEAEKS